MKIAVDFSPEELRALDAIGERTGRTRNAVISDAVDALIAAEDAHERASGRAGQRDCRRPD